MKGPATGVRRTALAVLASAVLAGGVLTGCASVGGFLPMASRSDEPWQIPEDAFPTQRLFRIDYDGPEGDLSFKLVLYLESRSRFRMDASDTLGRKVWTLSVDDDDRAIWLDHREDLYCRVEGASGQSFVPIAYLPLVHLPRLILGRMPADPDTDLRRSDDRISYVDASGQTWSGQLDAEGRVLWWSLVEAGEAVAWWKLQADDDESRQIFVDRRRHQEVRWVEQVRESLPQALEPPTVPDRYEQTACGDSLDAPPPTLPPPTPPRSSVQDVEDPFHGLGRGGSLDGP